MFLMHNVSCNVQASIISMILMKFSNSYCEISLHQREKDILYKMGTKLRTTLGNTHPHCGKVPLN